MKLSIGALILATSSVAAFQQPQVVLNRQSVVLAMNNGEETESSRRSFVSNGMAAIAGLGLSQPAFASLLDDFGTDPTSKIETAPKKKEVREAVVAKGKEESNFEPNLRSNYYYPTNKKRYLPRIKKCNDAIPDAAAMIGSEDWVAAAEFADKVAEDTILPMKLYTSSLLGGGTNVKVSFAKDMNKAAADFEKSQKALSKAIAKKDRQKSSAALEDLSSALLSYRTAGRLLGPDGGGDIPSVDEIRRAACRVQGRTFEQKVKSRDARLKEASS